VTIMYDFSLPPTIFFNPEVYLHFDERSTSTLQVLKRIIYAECELLRMDIELNKDLSSSIEGTRMKVKSTSLYSMKIIIAFVHFSYKRTSFRNIYWALL
jgi:hypothetical protein